MRDDARQYLFSLERIGIKLGLDQVRTLVTALDRPDRAFPAITVAGTNGKGSVTAMIERGLRAAGFRTGRFTSPHLVDLEERFAIDGRAVTGEVLDSAAARMRDAAATMALPPTFFEATTAMALDIFREARIDVAVLEVGLGGRLDATNVVDADVVAITSIDFDHEQYLGHTLEAIAGEKAGVIKPGSLAVLARNPQTVRDVVAARCHEVSATLIYAPDATTTAEDVRNGLTRLTLTTAVRAYDEMTLALRGRHQIENAVTAVRLLEELGGRMNLDVPARAIATGLTEVDWPGRLELRQWTGREVLIDGAHNPAGVRALGNYLEATYGRPLPFVVGMMHDKPTEAMLAVLASHASHLFTTAPAMARAAAPEELAAIARRVAPHVPVTAVDRPMAALERALERGQPAVVAGSLFLAGEIRAHLS